MVDQGFEQDRRAGLVDRRVALDGVHRLADADLGGEMDHAVGAFQRASDHVLVADIAADQLGVVGEIVGTLAIAVDLLDQAVEHSHLIAAAKQFLANGPADESGAAGDEHSFTQPTPPNLCYFPVNQQLAASSSSTDWRKALFPSRFVPAFNRPRIRAESLSCYFQEAGPAERGIGDRAPGAGVLRTRQSATDRRRGRFARWRSRDKRRGRIRAAAGRAAGTSALPLG